MKIAIPTFATRVSPRFDCAQDVLVVTIEAGGAPERQELQASDWTPHERINRLLDLKVDTVLCGGIDCRSVESFQSAGVTVYSWVTGEIEDALSALLHGDLDFQAAKQGGGRCRCRRFSGDNDSQGRNPSSAWAEKAAANTVEEEEVDMEVAAPTAHATMEGRRILTAIPTEETLMSSTAEDSNNVLVIAIPGAGGKLCMHFGHCEQFALFDVDTAAKKILNTRQLTPPPHQPGLLPRWLHEQGVNVVIAGSMGHRAQDIFAGNGIDVLVGAPAGSPESVVHRYLDGKLQPGENVCDH